MRRSSPAVRYALFFACLCVPAAYACAADVIGYVKTVKGSAHIERSGQNVNAAVGSEIYSGDRIVTGPDSFIGITLHDNTLLSEGANSTLELSNFAFNTTTYEGSLDAKIQRGSLAVVDGKIAKANPDAVRYSTPTTTLGVRGTEFIIEVGGDAEKAQ
jgi:hypothetical protein